MSSSSSLRRHGVVIERYEILRKIGQGSFGSVYVIKDLHKATADSNDSVFAMKVEKRSVKKPMLQYEYRVYKALKSSSRVCGVHSFHCDGPLNILVMDLLGDSIDSRFTKCGKSVKDTTAMWVLKHMFACIEDMHAAYFVHRDIKPHNFVMSTSPPYVKLIDMGLAKQYRTRNLEHIDCKTNRKLTGTVRYASANVHRGIEPSRRDDLESLIYVTIFLMRGKLPWQGVNAECKETKYAKIGEIKQSTLPESLCHGLPHEIYVLFKYVRGILFASKPDYAYMKSIIQDFLDRENLNEDIPQEWFATKGGS